MRKVAFFSFILLGGGAGYLWGLQDDWATRLVMIGVCLLFSGAIGGALASMGKARNGSRSHRANSSAISAGSAGHGRDMAANHWRDEGYAPHCNPKNFRKESTHVPHVPHKW